MPGLLPENVATLAIDFSYLLVAFLFIWAGLLVYSIGGLRAKAIPARS